jgi:hypothetical protein
LSVPCTANQLKKLGNIFCRRKITQFNSISLLMWV